MFPEWVVDLTNITLDFSAIIVCVISLLLGYLTFSLIAGLSGTSCSAMEDIQTANTTSVMIVMVCYIVACFTSAFDSIGINIATSIVPMISIFCAPVQYMRGDIAFGTLIVSWLLQIAVIAALALLCAKVYADLIIYSGKPLGFREIIKNGKK